MVVWRRWSDFPQIIILKTCFLFLKAWTLRKVQPWTNFEMIKSQETTALDKAMVKEFGRGVPRLGAKDGGLGSDNFHLRRSGEFVGSLWFLR